MKKYQISKNKSTFDHVLPKLVLAFGFTATIITLFWLIITLIGLVNGRDGESLYRISSIQVMSLPFYVAVSGLMIAKAMVNMKNKEFPYSTAINMICAIAILVCSVVYMTFFHFFSSPDDFVRRLERLIKYPIIASICTIWGLCSSFTQIKNNGKQDIHALKGSNASSALVTGCLMLPIYGLIFGYVFMPDVPEDFLTILKPIANVMFILVAIIFVAQLIIICLNQGENNKKAIVLLSVCAGLIFICYVLAKTFSQIINDRDWAYINLLCGLTTTSLTIPVFVKTRN